MKKILSINTLAALLMAGAAFTACSSEDTIIDEQPVVNPTQKTVIMTVQASKDEVAGTRGLSLSGSTLNAVWKTTDVIKVYKYNLWSTPVGTLHPTSNTSGTATLRGEVSVSDVNENEKLVLAIGGGGVNYDFTGQKGMLNRSDDPDNSIESKYDYASAGITQQSFYAHFLKDGDNDILTLSSSNTNTKYSETYDKATASFINQAAIVKFTLQDKSGNAVNASQFDISCIDDASRILLTSVQAGGGTLSVVPDTPTNELYVAILCQSSETAKNYRFTAYSDDTYTLNKSLSGYLFQPGKYYEVTMKMKAEGGWSTVDLSTSTPTSGSTINIDANAKVKLTGTLNPAYGIKVGAGATVMLDGATIKPATGESGVGVAGIHCLGNATIILNDGTENIVTGGENGANHYPGIYVASDYKLTIRGTGSLIATGQNGAAGIGAGNGTTDCQNAGNIQIENGTITANGGLGAAGIGGTSGGNGYSCSSITIKGATITANGGAYGAGIGGYCGDITITSGNITANAGQAIYDNYSGYASAAIGSNHNQSCENITITGGTITAIGRDALNDEGHDGANVTVIGASGVSGSCTSVTIGAGVNSVEMITNRAKENASTGHDNWSESQMTGEAFLRATTVTVAGTDITSLLNNNLVIANQTAIENAVKSTFTSSKIDNSGYNGWYFNLTK